MSDFGDPPPPFWLVWNRYGRQPVFEHENYISARREAERLSRANPGSAFYVLCPVARGGFDRSAIVWSHYQSDGNDAQDEFVGVHGPEVDG